jgi:hypothetical protein
LVDFEENIDWSDVLLDYYNDVLVSIGFEWARS